MKRNLISLIILIFIISVTMPVNAATTGSVTISLSNETIKAGDEFSIIVSATDTNNLNTIEYSNLTIKDETGNASKAITVKSLEAVGDNWAKMNAEGKINFVYSGDATQSQQVFKVTFSVSDSVKAGKYSINVEGLKVYSANLEDDTTEIGTKSVTVKAIVDDTTVGGNQGGGTPEDPGETEGTDDDTSEGTGGEDDRTPSDDGNNGNNGDNDDNGSDEGKKENVNTNKNTNKKPTKLPQTGVESASVMAIIILAAISIASYVSYRKYKNI